VNATTQCDDLVVNENRDEKVHQDVRDNHQAEQRKTARTILQKPSIAWQH